MPGIIRDSAGVGTNEWAILRNRAHAAAFVDIERHCVLVKGAFEVREGVNNGRVSGLYHPLADDVQR